MDRSRISWCTALCIGVAVGYARGSGPSEEVTRLMRMMPAGFAVTVVARNLERLDTEISGLFRRFDTEHEGPWIVADIKRDVPFGEWIDFSQPVGMALPRLGGEEDFVLWVNARDFAEKVKALEGAEEEEGIWRIPVREKETFFVKIRGDYVVAAMSKATLADGTREGKSLAEELKQRMNLFADRDALLHVNVEPLRGAALAGMAQFSQMAPMIGMLAGQQGGADPTTIAAVFTALFDACKQFVEQIAYVDASIAISDKAADLTVATGYKDGRIKAYLANRKPATIPLLAHVKKQPYFVAMSYHVPGEQSAFYDYICDKVASAIPVSPSAGKAPASGEDKTSAGPDALREAMRVAKAYYRSIEASNVVMGMSPKGMRISGDYYGKDPRTILELTKKSMTAANPLMMQFGTGAQYDALGSKEIGDTSVDQFTMKLDTTNPSAAAIAGLYGENPRFAIGVVGDRVRFCMGSERYVEKFFTEKVGKPFSSGRYVAEALATLPARRNAVVLIDLAGILPMIAAVMPPMAGQAMGMPNAEPIPPGPPVAISVSLSGEPARMDIHVPIRAVERLVQALAPDEPM